jgi:hypothetical protein
LLQLKHNFAMLAKRPKDGGRQPRKPLKCRSMDSTAVALVVADCTPCHSLISLLSLPQLLCCFQLL